MKKRRGIEMRGKDLPKLVTLAVLLLVSVVIVGQFFARGGTSSINWKPEENDSSLLEIAKYRQWTLINPVPVLMDFRAALDCVRRVDEKPSPHASSYVSVYVNPTGAYTMMAKTRPLPPFPKGSIIVKEKLSAKNSQSPQLLTVMVKREEGYNPKSRDWEYLVLDGPATQVLERGKMARCNRCHEAYPDTDFVTMRYLNWKPTADRLR